jgi:nicotinamidase-related amidase
MKNILVVVDMQNDFVDGELGSKEAVSIVDNVVEEIKAFDGEVVFTKDTHGYDYLTTPPLCKGYKGLAAQRENSRCDD